ncbi:MAG: hypothetical protein TR69_WS6001000928 [candidate division WS6 bacterium OLB20]|uniref:Fimbrial assembly protein (PilN) n=1 Tax=candidate division WS6 bacterium OLB20 TaxID=1617426 RepID=A0A136LZ25_9BACT|nr:MAG: hypothetical protein TR69_WS6001000928 [candidate division WS6 bacterium OLB20]
MWTRVYDWVVGSARVVVIIVELVVVVAFAIRIVVDVQSNNLNEQIETKEAIVKTFQQAELRYLSTQSKTDAYRDLWETSTEFSSVFAEIVGYLPTTSSELIVQISKRSGLFISGSAEVAEIADMESGFKNSTSFTRQELDSIEGEGSIIAATFAFSAQFSALTTKVLPSANDTTEIPGVTPTVTDVPFLDPFSGTDVPTDTPAVIP